MLRGFTPQASLDAPRFCISAGTPDANTTSAAGDINSEVYFEEGISEETVAKLRGEFGFAEYEYWVHLSNFAEMGHDARVASGFGRGLLGRGQVIQKISDASGRTVWAAGSDPRADGHAVAQI